MLGGLKTQKVSTMWCWAAGLRHLWVYHPQPEVFRESLVLTEGKNE